jgi:NAD+ kinase
VKVILYFSDKVPDRKGIVEMVVRSGFEVVKSKPDMVLAFGGDGTLLKAESDLPGIPKVLISSSEGSLSYLSSGSVCELESLLEKIKKGFYKVNKKMKIVGRIGDGLTEAVNDVFLTTEIMGKSIKIVVEVDGKKFFIANCDGVIFFTPTGSTAYSLSCGGPILRTDSIGITLLNPHLMPTKYFVVDKKSKIKVKLLAGSMLGVFDGLKKEKINNEIEITTSKNQMRAVILKEKRIPEVCPPGVII